MKRKLLLSKSRLCRRHNKVLFFTFPERNQLNYVVIWLYIGVSLVTLCCTADYTVHWTLCIRRTLCRHVTIGTPMVIFAVLTVF